MQQALQSDSLSATTVAGKRTVVVDFAERLEELEEETGLSATQLGVGAGFSVGTVTNWRRKSERGELRATADLIAFAVHYGKTVEWLLGDPTPTPYRLKPHVALEQQREREWLAQALIANGIEPLVAYKTALTTAWYGTRAPEQIIASALKVARGSMGGELAQPSDFAKPSPGKRSSARKPKKTD